MHDSLPVLLGGGKRRKSVLQLYVMQIYSEIYDSGLLNELKTKQNNNHS